MAEIDDTNAEYIRAVTVAGIIYKFREKQPLTAGERQDLDDWINKGDANKTLFDELLQRERVVAELEALNGYDYDSAVSSVFAAIGLSRSPVVSLRSQTMRRSVTAAAILLLIVSGWWFFFMRRNSGGQSAGMANIASLSRDRAVLTLGDGRQVSLDSAHAGPMDSQGGASVRQEVGRLVYTVARNADGGPTVYNTLTVPRGAQYHVVLADSSEVWLNAASSITYPTTFTANARELTVTGEAYFRIAKDATKPFLVTSRAMKVQVLGTEFNLMAYPDEPAIRTTLINGAVKTTVDFKQRPPQQLLLRPGEQAAVDSATGLLHLEKPNVDAVTGWHYGEFRCHNAELPTILRQIARWYDVSIEYRGSVSGINFDGVLSRKHRLEEVLDILADTRKVYFEFKSPGTVVVIPGTKPHR
ncbi:MAG: FecR domain-containing protein [Bacteroidetes bacterium]|nr:FecR domain-containing protein [Bacteroidota bacterium]